MSMGMAPTTVGLCEVVFGAGGCVGPAGLTRNLAMATSVSAVGAAPPTVCSVTAGVTAGGSWVASLVAIFSAAGPSSNRCKFNVPGGTCQLRNDNGLPVELLDFYIEASGDSQSEGTQETGDITTEDGTVSKP